MTKQRLFFLLVFFLSGLSLVAAIDDLQCVIQQSTTCSAGLTKLIGLQNDSGGYNNAHAQNFSLNTYGNSICCNNTNPSITIGNSCTSGNSIAVVVKLFDHTNSHVEIGSNTNYTVSACLTSSSRNLSCTYPTGSCSADSACIMSLAGSDGVDTSNAHVGECSRYNQKVCCGYSNSGPSMASSRIVPAPTALSSQNLTGYCNATDADSDDLFYYYKWYRDGTVYYEGTAFANGTISAGGDHVCGIRASDGYILCWGENSGSQLGNGSDGGNTSTPTLIANSSSYLSVSSGASTTCAIRAEDRRLVCWGTNAQGQLGIGISGSDAPNPVLVSSTDAYSSVSVGGSHACAIRANDSLVFCWGRNSAGQLGNGSVGGELHTPTLIANTSAFSRISLGDAFTCGIRTSDGRIVCWGSNLGGQIGNGSVGGNTGIPTAIVNESSFSTVASGLNFVCGIRSSNGRVMCWGDNIRSQLGNGTGGGGSGTPMLISNSQSYSYIDLGAEQACAVSSMDKQGLCWGRNNFGQMGNGSVGGSSADATVIYLNDSLLHITTGDEFSCAHRGYDGRLVCWGNNLFGQLANGSVGGESGMPSLTTESTLYALGFNQSTEITIPVSISSLNTTIGENWTISCSAYDLTYSSAYLNSSATQIINADPAMNTTRIYPTPNATTDQDLVGFCNASDADGDDLYYSYKWYKENVVYYQGIAFKNGTISVSNDFACGVRANDSRVFCWGDNTHGQLGNGSSGGSSTVPISTADTAPYLTVVTGDSHSCGIRANDSRVLCWGRNSFGKLGQGTEGGSNPTPTAINHSSEFSMLDAGSAFVCGIESNTSRVICWGWNFYGQIGLGTNGTNEPNPVYVNDTGAYSALGVGMSHVCAIRTNDSRVLCWGDNSAGQLGNGSYTSGEIRMLPTLTNDTSPYVFIDGGQSHSCGIRASDSRVLCWGDNDHGHLGRGTISAVDPNPGVINDANQYLSVSIGGETTCALRSDLRILCWGRNTVGQLANGSMGGEVYNPALISSTDYFVNVDGEGFSHSTMGFCATRVSDGRVLCWGDNSWGELGNGSIGGNISTPTLTSDTSSYAGRFNSSSEMAITYMISNIFTEAGQNWTASCRAYDGYAFSSFQNSTETQIVSSAPSMLSARIFPTPTATDFQNLTGFCNASDADGDDLYYSYKWYKENVVYYQGIAFKNGSISVGWEHACGIRVSDGRVMCWGDNAHGQLGNGSTGSAVGTPQLTADTSSYREVRAGAVAFSCGIRANDSRVLCWGRDNQQQLGNGALSLSQTSPGIINNSDQFRTISMGLTSTCGLRENDSIMVCWGSGSFGNGSLDGQLADPKVIEGHPAYKMVAMSEATTHSCGLRANDSIALCWGANGDGKLGNGSITGDAPSPVQINDSSPYSFIAVGTLNSCGIRGNDSRALCWGNNLYGQLGTNSPDSATPVLVNDTSRFVYLELAYRTACAIRQDGKVYCWGENNLGQLGNGSFGGNGADRPIPINDSTPYLQISVQGTVVSGDDTICGVRAPDGRLMCWGDNENGKFGNGSVGGNSSTPVASIETASFADGFDSSSEATILFDISNVFTSIGQNWTLTCSAYNAAGASSFMNSTATQIVDSAPQVTLTYPINGNTTVFERYVNFAWTATDPDGDSLNFTINATCGNACPAHCAPINAFTTDDNYTHSSPICIDQSYNWSVYACAGGQCTQSTTFNFTILSVADLVLIVNTTTFSNLGQGQSDSTADDSPGPMVARNNGNVLLNVTINATALFTSESLGTNYYRFMADFNESSSYVAGCSQTTFANMSGTPSNLLCNMSYLDASDEAQIELNITVPVSEPAGSKSSTVQIDAVTSEV